MSAPVPTDTSAERRAALTGGDLEVEGRLVEASNVVLRVWATLGDTRVPAVYKPVRGERPLWDFPEGSLAAREVAAWQVCDACGLASIPPTVLRDGPLGPGSVQQWVGPLEEWTDAGLVRVDPPDHVPDSFAQVLEAQDSAGAPLVVSHSTDDAVRAIALLDVVLNNADRKGSAMILEGDRVWAIDHGLCFHVEDKLRTVLWGFAGERLREAEKQALCRMLERLDGSLGESLRSLLEPAEVEALRQRSVDLLVRGEFPGMPWDRTPLPWPLW